MLESHTAPGGLTRAARLLVAGPALGFDRLVVRTKTLARRSGMLRRAVRRFRYGIA